MSFVLSKLPNPPIPRPRGRVYPPPSPAWETHPSHIRHVVLRSLPSVVLFFAVREAKRSPKDAKRRQEAPRERQRDAKMGQRARQGGPKGDQGRPREAKRRPRGGQEDQKGGQRAAKRGQGEAKGKPKRGQDRESDFLKMSVSPRRRAHFQGEGQAQPGQRGLAKPGQGREGVLGQSGGSPGRVWGASEFQPAS